jgi:hypothetical protein
MADQRRDGLNSATAFAPIQQQTRTLTPSAAPTSGLKLGSAKTRVSMLVIDQVNHPSEN